MKWEEIEREHYIRSIKIGDGWDKNNKELWKEVEYYRLGEDEWEASTKELGVVYSYCCEGCRRELIKRARQKMEMKPSKTFHEYKQGYRLR